MDGARIDKVLVTLEQPEQAMKIADIELGDRPLLLAPMEDVTDPSFRYMCKRFGADVVYTEFISSDGLIRDAAKSLKKLEIDDAERPVGIQIYGHLIEPMVEAARMAEAAGPDIIDINFGCPVKKIAGRGAGSGMMRDVPLMVEMTRRIVAAVKTPVTVKTRLGWDEESKNIEEIALRLQDVGHRGAHDPRPYKGPDVPRRSGLDADRTGSRTTRRYAFRSSATATLIRVRKPGRCSTATAWTA